MNSIENLLALGFNRLEAAVYIQLLSHPLSTAYKIGKLLNKPTANVYKAMDSLAEKGAVFIENDKTKRCKAVAPELFFEMYKKSIIAKTEKAKETFSQLNHQPEDQAAYSLQSVDLVFEKATQMLQHAKKIIVVDAFPKTLERISGQLSFLGKKGLTIYVEAYHPINIPFVKVHVNKQLGEQALQHWQSQQLNVMVDGEAYLTALLSNDLSTVKQATYSQNTYMSCLLLAGALKEQVIIELLNNIKNPDFENKAKKILEEAPFFYNTAIPGFQKLKNL